MHYVLIIVIFFVKKLPLTTEKEADVTVSVWDDTVKAIDVGQEAADWFSLYLNKVLHIFHY